MIWQRDFRTATYI